MTRQLFTRQLRRRHRLRRAFASPARALAHAGQESGQALVEFALVAVMLVIIVLGVAWFGLAFFQYNTETSLASEAARYAAVNYNPATQQPWASAQDLLNYMKGSSQSFPSGSRICVSFPDGNNSALGEPVKVAVSAPYPLSWTPVTQLTGVVGAPTTITASATMRLESGSSITAGSCGS
jgi:Flp pilus assembly protein TadG